MTTHHNNIWYKIEKSIKLRGIFGTVLYTLRWLRTKIINIPSVIKKVRARKKEINMDRKYEIDTLEIVERNVSQVESVNSKYAMCYEATLWMDFNKLLSSFNLPYESMTFIDLGAGKGRPLLMAASLPFKNVIGVEFSEELVGIAKENIKKFPKENMQCKYIDIICLDVVQYDFPKDGLVVYLFNPFEKPVMEQVIKNLRQSYEKNKRPMLIMYKFPVYEDLWAKENFLHLSKEYVFEEYMYNYDIKLNIYTSEHFKVS